MAAGTSAEQARDGTWSPTSNVLDSLEAQGVRVIHARSVPGCDSDIDHLAIGTGGVFVIEAKFWSGLLAVGRDGLRRNGRSRQRHVRDASERALVLQQLVERLNPARPIVITPVLCFGGEARLGARRRIHDVELVDIDDLASLVCDGPPALAESDVIELAAALERGLPPRTGYSEAESLALRIEPPPEPVMFLTPWRKHGNDRLYVMDEMGTQGGYLDLKTGEVVEELAAIEPILLRLLPHFLADDSDLELSGKARSSLVRFFSRRDKGPNPYEQESFVVGISAERPRPHLAVHRLDTFGHRISLGSFDLVHRLVAEVSPETEPTVRYCGEQYLAWELD